MLAEHLQIDRERHREGWMVFAQACVDMLGFVGKFVNQTPLDQFEDFGVNLSSSKPRSVVCRNDVIEKRRRQVMAILER